MRPPNPEQELALAKIRELLVNNPGTPAATAAAATGRSLRYVSHLMKIARAQLGQPLTPNRGRQGGRRRRQLVSPREVSLCKRAQAEAYYQRLLELQQECTRRQLSLHQVLMQAIDLWKKRHGDKLKPSCV